MKAYSRFTGYFLRRNMSVDFTDKLRRFSPFLRQEDVTIDSILEYFERARTAAEISFGILSARSYLRHVQDQQDGQRLRDEVLTLYTALHALGNRMICDPKRPPSTRSNALTLLAEFICFLVLILGHFEPAKFQRRIIVDSLSLGFRTLREAADGGPATEYLLKILWALCSTPAFSLLVLENLDSNELISYLYSASLESDCQLIRELLTRFLIEAATDKRERYLKWEQCILNLCEELRACQTLLVNQQQVQYRLKRTFVTLATLLRSPIPSGAQRFADSSFPPFFVAGYLNVDEILDAVCPLFRHLADSTLETLISGSEVPQLASLEYSLDAALDTVEALLTITPLGDLLLREHTLRMILSYLSGQYIKGQSEDEGKSAEICLTAAAICGFRYGKQLSRAWEMLATIVSPIADSMVREMIQPTIMILDYCSGVRTCSKDINSSLLEKSLTNMSEGFQSSLEVAAILMERTARLSELHDVRVTLGEIAIRLLFVSAYPSARSKIDTAFKQAIDLLTTTDKATIPIFRLLDAVTSEDESPLLRAASAVIDAYIRAVSRHLSLRLREQGFNLSRKLKFH